MFKNESKYIYKNISMIWFLNPFINIYGKRLKKYNIDKDFIILLKPYYEDVNDYDFYLSLIKMKLTFNI